MPDVYLGHQRVYDARLNVVAYELLFRDADSGEAGVVDGDQATAQVLMNALFDIGLETFAGHCPVLLNVTREFLLARNFESLDPKRFILEILEDVEPDAELVEAARSARDAGFRIALDDFVYSEKFRPLLAQTDLVKLDVRQSTLSELPRQVQALRQLGVPQILAEKVETPEEFERCVALGFELFQGYFLSRPKVVQAKTVETGALNTITLLASLRDPQVGIDQLERIVSRDVGLSHKLLQTIHSAATGIRNRVVSIRQAIALIGIPRLRSLTTLIALSRLGNQPMSLTILALTRARMCEFLGRSMQRPDVESFYVVGLFSLLDAMLNAPLDAIIGRLPLSDDVRKAILTRTGLMGDALHCAIAAERTPLDVPHRLPLSNAMVRAAYWHATAAVQSDLADLELTDTPADSKPKRQTPQAARV